MKGTQLFSHWTQIREELLETIEKFSENELTYAPTKSSWPAGKIMLHIGDAEDHWFRYGIHREISQSQSYELAVYPNKESIIAVLAKIHDRTERYLDTWSLADMDQEIEMPWNERHKLGWIIWHVVEHEIHHRGELSMMLGLLGREGLDV